MRAKFILVVLAFIGSILYLVYTIGDVQRRDQERQIERAFLTAGITLFMEERLEEVPISEAKYTESEPLTVQESTATHQIQITGADAIVLERLAMAEAEGEGIEGKALVMMVVMNRVQDPRFPDSIEEVVFQESQFSTVSPDGRYWKITADDECKDALQLIENGWDESGGALYFESCTKDSWQSRNCKLLFEYGGHRFYE